MSKYFLLNPYKGTSDKKDISAIQEREEGLLKFGDFASATKAKQKITEEDNLIHTEGRIICKVDMSSKKSYSFEDGTKIKLEREFNNFNRRYTQPVNTIVISGEDIPKGAEMLVDHNALHETNRINDYKNEFEDEGTERIRYFSIPYNECYAWRMNTEDWTPVWPFEFGLRIFKPYEGVIENIEPKVLKDTLYCTSGEYRGLVLKTLKGCDYQIIFQQKNGREDYLICWRPNGNSKTKLEEEAIAILHYETELVEQGKLLIGYEIKDAKPQHHEYIFNRRRPTTINTTTKTRVE